MRGRIDAHRSTADSAPSCPANSRTIGDLCRTSCPAQRYGAISGFVEGKLPGLTVLPSVVDRVLARLALDVPLLLAPAHRLTRQQRDIDQVAGDRGLRHRGQ